MWNGKPLPLKVVSNRNVFSKLFSKVSQIGATEIRRRGALSDHTMRLHFKLRKKRLPKHRRIEIIKLRDQQLLSDRRVSLFA